MDMQNSCYRKIFHRTHKNILIFWNKSGKITITGGKEKEALNMWKNIRNTNVSYHTTFNPGNPNHYFFIDYVGADGEPHVTKYEGSACSSISEALEGLYTWYEKKYAAADNRVNKIFYEGMDSASF